MKKSGRKNEEGEALLYRLLQTTAGSPLSPDPLASGNPLPLASGSLPSPVTFQLPALGDGARRETSSFGEERQLQQDKKQKETKSLTKHHRETPWSGPGVYHLKPCRTEGDPGQHKVSPRRSETGNEPRSTRPYSTVPLPAPSLRNACGGRGPRRCHARTHGRAGRDPGQPTR
ncbi:hypothetical protein GWK47_014414 [Chionoecetes opilio]|uniref:Uncharacterized protein n=1 Tax=Chionoecetes opilio TaxID=41210 RepID=A0A8J5CKJ0_CHIOP|nr:hypothetical protein GWK47_014414 [Chionoecetes opilio]